MGFLDDVRAGGCSKIHYICEDFVMHLSDNSRLLERKSFPLFVQMIAGKLYLYFFVCPETEN